MKRMLMLILLLCLLCSAAHAESTAADITVGPVTVKSDIAELDLDSLTTEAIPASDLLTAFAAMPNLTHVTMFEQPIAVADMETILAAFPNVDFDWTVQLDQYRIRTDATAFSTLKGRQEPRYTTEDLEPLKYCTELLAIDLGHNNVSDLSFLTQWPHLKILIIVDSKNPITDITPLAELHELEYVELFMQGITDLTPLSNKPNLLDLNLCHNNATDLTPLLTNTSMERLWISFNRKLSKEQIKDFKAAMPNLRMETEEYQSTGAGWRNHKRYEVIKEVFSTRIYRPFDAADNP